MADTALQRNDSFDFGLAKPESSRSIASVQGTNIQTLATEFPFLRADHSFDASSLSVDAGRDPSSICLSFDEGDVVFVHWVHDLGWGDVTLLHSGKRGWIPINYFSPCTDAKAIPLLSAAANFISAPKSYQILRYDGNEGIAEHSFSQAAINEVVSGVRALLDLSGTLSRESPMAQRSQAIRRYRKALLTELAYLVSVAKHNKKSTDDAVIDRLVRGCFRIVNKAVALLDVWHEEAEDSSINSQTSPRAISESNSSSELTKEAMADTPPTPTKAGSGQNAKASPDLRVDEVSTALCDYLGIFVHRLGAIGSDPTASVQILTNTRHCMLACRELLVVVEAISASSTPRNQELERLKDAMFVHIRHLVHAARSLVASLSKTPESVSQASQNLSNVARECSRLACECTVWCHAVLQNDSEGDKIPVTRIISANDDNGNMEELDASGDSADADRTVTDFRDSTPTSRNSTTYSPDLESSPPTHHRVSTCSCHSKTSNENMELNRSSVQFTDGRKQSEGTIASSARSVAPSVSSESSGEIERPQPLPLEQDTLVECESESDDSSPDSGSENLAAEEARRVYTSSSLYVNNELTESQVEEDARLRALSPDLMVKGAKVYGGTADALVIWLSDSQTSEFFIHTFFLTFRLYFNPSEVAACIMTHKSIGLATVWVESYFKASDVEFFNDFAKLGDEHLLESMNKRRALPSRTQLVEPAPMGSYKSDDVQRCQTHTATNSIIYSGVLPTPLSSNAASRRTSRNVVRRVSHEDLRIMSSTWTFKFGSGNSNASDIGTKLLEHDEAAIAAQLYLIDWEIFSQIKPEELVDKRFAKSKRNLGLSPHVVELVTRSNYLSAFVGETVLGNKNVSVKTRKNIIRSWIRIANHCYELGNLNSLVTIVSTLRSSSIVRLRKVWDLISPKKMAIIDKLSRLVAPDRNFAEYRAELRKRERQGNCIPYLGLYLGDLTFIDEGNPKTRAYNGKSIINFDRYARTCEVISRIQTYQVQTLPSNVTLDKNLNTWLRDEMTKSHNALIEDQDGQWRKSCIIEPPA